MYPPIPDDQVHFVIKGIDQIKTPDRIGISRRIRLVNKIGICNEIMKVDKIGKYCLISGVYKMRRIGRIKHQEKR